MAKLGKAVVHIHANLKPLKRGLALAKAAVKAAMGSITSIIKTAARTTARAAKWAVAGLVAIGVASTKMAMDVEESENLFEVSMKGMADSTRAWSEDLATAFKMNSNTIRKQVGIMKLMVEGMGIGAEQATNMAKGLVQLTFDAASLRNVKLDEMFNKIGAAMMGEAEGLKRLGINIQDTAVKQFALNEGLVKTGKELTIEQKVVARYMLLIRRLKDDTGDMVRTQDSLTNVLRSIWEQFKFIGAKIGGAFIKPVTEAGVAIRDWLVSPKNQSMIVEWSERFVNALITIKDALLDIVNFMSKDWGAGLNKGLTAAKDMFKAFAELIYEMIKATFLSIGEDAADWLAEGKYKKREIGKITKRLYGEGFSMSTAEMMAKDEFANRPEVAAKTSAFSGRMNPLLGEFTGKVKTILGAAAGPELTSKLQQVYDKGLKKDREIKDRHAKARAKMGAGEVPGVPEIPGAGEFPSGGAGGGRTGIPKPRIVGIKEAWKQMVTGILGGQGTPTDRNTKELVVQAKLTNKEIRMQRKEIKEALRQPGTRAAWALP